MQSPNYPWRFFALALAWSWLFWLTAVFVGGDVQTFPTILLLFAGGLGPMLAALFLLYCRGDSSQQHDYWKRVFDMRRIGVKWWVVILLTPPLLKVLALLLDVLAGGIWPDFESVTQYLTNPLSLLLFAISMLFFGPVPEELGWRGYGLDGLQASWNALASSLIILLALLVTIICGPKSLACSLEQERSTGLSNRNHSRA